VIGTDANADGLREISRRASRKPARGGLPNVLFGRLSLEDAPGELAQLADAITVLFPWGSLLRAVAVPECEALRRLALIGKPGARFRFLHGYGVGREARAVDELGLPALGDPSTLRALEDAYAEARYVSREEVALIQTTWAKKIAFSDHERVFVELSGISNRAVEESSLHGTR